MALPKYQEILVPALKLLKERGSLKLREFESPLAEEFALAPEEVAEEYPSRNGKIFYDRISWAMSHMYMADLVEKPSHGVYQISEAGRKQLESPENIYSLIDNQMKKRRKYLDKENGSSDDGLTPLEELLASLEEIRQSVYDEIIDTILDKTPKEFEKLVVELLQCMGYGDEITGAGEVTQCTNDKGIDGIIKEDVLGLGRIHIQAKRYARENRVGREDIQKFVGALAGAQANKGVFITTSSFAKTALEFVENLNAPSTIVLVDGEQLAKYIYEFNVGMQIEQTIELKKLDGGFWDAMEDVNSLSA